MSDIKCLRENEFRIISRKNLFNVGKFINTQNIYIYICILILASRFLRQNFIPFLIDVQAVIGKNLVIYYGISARMFQEPSSKERMRRRGILLKGLFIGNVFGEQTSSSLPLSYKLSLCKIENSL